MAWFLRAIEQADGGWVCKFGTNVFDRHEKLPEAVDHLRGIGATMQPAELFVHWHDGKVEKIGQA